MKYRPDKNGVMISQLGYGCMRFTRKGPNVDFEKAEREVMRAIEAGVNYFDTAYLYPGSEACLGEILQKHHCRDKVLITPETMSASDRPHPAALSRRVRRWIRPCGIL